jgi:hypothetical protein
VNFSHATDVVFAASNSPILNRQASEVLWTALWLTSEDAERLRTALKAKRSSTHWWIRQAAVAE